MWGKTEAQNIKGSYGQKIKGSRRNLSLQTLEIKNVQRYEDKRCKAIKVQM
jgi:hypothetical protein